MSGTKNALCVVVALVLVSAGAVAATCTGQREPHAEQTAGRAAANDHFYENFKTAVAAHPARNFTVYWLGEGFTSGGLDYTGPEFPDFGATNDADILGFSYGNRYDAASKEGGTTLSVGLFSTARWADVRESAFYLRGAPEPRLAERTVSGREITTVQRLDRDGTVSSNALAVDMDGTIVFLEAPVPVLPGGGSGPSLQVDDLVSLINELRPYPE